jgi:hypothetical protein
MHIYSVPMGIGNGFHHWSGHKVVSAANRGWVNAEFAAAAHFARARALERHR